MCLINFIKSLWTRTKISAILCFIEQSESKDVSYLAEMRKYEK